MADVLLVVSNLAFLIPSIQAAYLHRFTRAAIFFLMIFASGLYHLCKAYSSTCVFDAQVHRKLDFFFAQLIIPVTALYFIYFPPKWRRLERWLIILFAVVLFVLEVLFDEAFFIQMILAIVGFFIIVFYWIGFAIDRFATEGKARLPHYDWNMVVLGIVFTFMAVSLFATQKGWPQGYWAIHSDWHILAALGQYFILLIRPAAPAWAAVDARINGAPKARPKPFFRA